MDKLYQSLILRIYMTIQHQIESKITSALNPSLLQIENESSQHRAQMGGESHFKILIVSAHFEGQGRVARQRDVHQLLSHELAHGVHALSLRLMTPQEWQQTGAESFVSPHCHGHAKKD